MIGWKQLIWGVQNLASWIAEAKKVAAMAGGTSNSHPRGGTADAKRSSAVRGSSVKSGDERGIPLDSNAGKWHVGHQLRFFNREADGSWSVTQPTWLNLYYTEGRSFKLTGNVLLSDRLNEDPPCGFALYLREYDSLHRYEVTCLGIRIRHRLIKGKISAPESAVPFSSEGQWVGNWQDFSADVGEHAILIKVGSQTGVMDGPLDTEGANKIVLCPGAKLRDLRITLLA